MATIKPIEATSVHQIQSGQVIVDLCSVAKELVENSLDAGATSVEVRFKNNGLDAIEVQDNGSGISPANYENVALKHYTSKLASYDDLSTLQTFGFRGEALSSLSALSKLYITTAQAEEAPKGKRLEFDVSGRLKSTTLVACQKGTTVTVEGIFESLPVRRKELAKNIKREYGKVLGLLQAYACVSVHVKFTVKNTMPKGKSVTVFSTKSNATTRENIANVYGAKTLAALAPLDLELDFRPTLTQLVHKDKARSKIHVRGHISKPVFGEGRQTPDRQMFFVNGRPCGLPQIAKAINEVYKAFNVTQSPFIFADLQMDTNAYDVNVSPDKRTILLHDSAALIENLKTALNEMFDSQAQTVPHSQLQTSKFPAFQKLSFQKQTPSASPDEEIDRSSVSDQSMQEEERQASAKGDGEDENGPGSLMRDHFANYASTRGSPKLGVNMQGKKQNQQKDAADRIRWPHTGRAEESAQSDADDEAHEVTSLDTGNQEIAEHTEHNDLTSYEDGVDERHLGLQSGGVQANNISRPSSPEIPSTMASSDKEEPGVVPTAFDRMRPKRVPAGLATVQIGEETFTTVLGSQHSRLQRGTHQFLEKRKVAEARENSASENSAKSSFVAHFSQKLRKFSADTGELSSGGEIAERSDSPAPGDADSDDEVEIKSEQLTQSLHESLSPDDNDLDGDIPSSPQVAEDLPDGDYVDEAEKKRAEEARVAELIRVAEETATTPSKDNLKRSTKALSGGRNKDSTTNLFATVDFSISSIAEQMRTSLNHIGEESAAQEIPATNDDADPETQLSLTVSKADFARMDIVGQFNLGFILAVRPAQRSCHDGEQKGRDELFIIDQHASDEKYNFERLQAETVVGNQRLVQPAILDLTAVEEEIVLENRDALEKNGFIVDIDISGESMVGQRCRLVSLPLSKEVVFTTQDLEELIHLLAEAQGVGSEHGAGVPRPSKVRKMFAMRACRSSIMIGKTLSKKQMEKVVTHMGTIDKPWNCPHGRPTMRHLCSLTDLESWHEGDGEAGEDRGSLAGQRPHELVHRYLDEIVKQLQAPPVHVTPWDDRILREDEDVKHQDGDGSLPTFSLSRLPRRIVVPPRGVPGQPRPGSNEPRLNGFRAKVRLNRTFPHQTQR
ncbi:ATP-binding mismatch repair protein [Exophiala dermatitidis]|nr:ATP-binding mismatch repair protein [Exophiala dermatitidis]